MLGSVAKIFRSEDVAKCQNTTLRLALVISFLCATPGYSAASNTIEVEVLVHSSKMI